MMQSENITEKKVTLEDYARVILRQRFGSLLRFYRWKETLRRFIKTHCPSEYDMDTIEVSLKGGRTPDCYMIIPSYKSGQYVFVWMEIENTNMIKMGKLNFLTDLWSSMDGTEYWNLEAYTADRYGRNLRRIDLMANYWLDICGRKLAGRKQIKGHLPAKEYGIATEIDPQVYLIQSEKMKYPEEKVLKLLCNMNTDSATLLAIVDKLMAVLNESNVEGMYDTETIID